MHNKPFLFRSGSFWSALVALSPLVLSGATSAEAAPTFDSDEILIKFAPATSIASTNARIQSANASVGATMVKRYAQVGWHKVRLPRGKSVQQAIAQYRGLSGVVAAEPDYIYYAKRLPNDPSYSRLYGMTQIGAPQVWDSSTGSSSVVVAVLDTGVDYRHPDLTANMWRNPGETGNGRERNGIDDDANGYVDDVFGINSITGSGDPMDDHQHGTHCAGTIGAVGNNGVGVAGVNWTTRIMALKFLAASGSGRTSDAIEAYNYIIARKNAGVNIRVVNNSWGSDFFGFSQAMVDAMRQAEAKGILSVVAAGNESTDNDSYPAYPSSNDVDSLISVAAGNAAGNLDQEFSNYGATSVDLAAPGVDILSTVPGGGYAVLSGTSMATPHVAGAAALLFARNSTRTPAQIKSVLMSTVTRNSSFNGKVASGGRLNLAAAFAATPTAPSTPPTLSKPVNDNFVDATVVYASSGRATGTNVRATMEVGEENAHGTSVWWRWTAPRSGLVSFNTKGSSFDTILSATVGTNVANLTTFTTDDDGGGDSTSVISFQATGGQTYVLKVDGFSGMSGTVILSWLQQNNNQFANAQLLEGNSGQAVDNNTTATWQSGEPGDSSMKTLWWKWTPGTGGLATFDTKGSSFDTILDVYRGTSLSDLVPMASDNDSGGNKTSRLAWQANPTTQYFIRVRGVGAATGDIVLNHTLNNDNVANAYTISAMNGTVTASSLGATAERGESALNRLTYGSQFESLFSWGTSLWWKWTPIRGGTVTFNTIGSDFDTYLTVLEGQPFDGFSVVAHNDESGEFHSDIVIFDVVPGKTYYILVDGYGGDTGDVVLNWNLPNSAPTVAVPNPSIFVGARPGELQKITTTLRDENSASDFREVRVQVGTSNTASDPALAHSLTARLRVKEWVLELLNDAGTAWMSVALPASGERKTLRNASGTVTLGRGDVVLAGDEIRVAWSLTRNFNSGADLWIRTSGMDGAGVTTAPNGTFTTIGRWKVMPPTTVVIPSPMLTMASPVNTVQVVRTDMQDLDGAGTITEAWLQINATNTWAKSLTVRVTPNSKMLWIRSDDGLFWKSVAIPDSGVRVAVSNSQGRVLLGSKDIVREGNTLTINWRVIRNGLPQTHTISTFGTDTTDAESSRPFVKIGTWTVTSPTTTSGSTSTSVTSPSGGAS